MGSVVIVHSTAKDGFEGSVAESRMTKFVREGVGDLKEQVRSALSTSIEAPPLPANGALIRFQHAVGFDAANGATLWGGGTIVDGYVEYIVVGDQLVRRVLDPGKNVVQGQSEVVVRNLDLTNGPPVTFEWDDVEGLVSADINVTTSIGHRDVHRSVSTVVHVQNVFDF